MEIINLSGGGEERVEFIKHPFRLLVAGPSASGKSNMVLNLILRYLDYDFIYIYTKHPDDEMYQKLAEHFEKINRRIQKKFKIPDYTCYLLSDDYENMVTNEQLDKSRKNLIVIDDFMMEKNKQNIQDLAVSCRHRNCSLIFISQSYHKSDKLLRENVSYLALYKVATKKEILEIAKSVAVDMDTKEFIELFNRITGKRYGFMVIDRTETMLPKYRDGWDIFVISENNNQKE